MPGIAIYTDDKAGDNKVGLTQEYLDAEKAAWAAYHKAVYDARVLRDNALALLKN